MMKQLIVGRTYKTNRSSLKILIFDVVFCNQEYVKAKIGLTQNGILCERPKYYKIQWKNIQHWEIDYETM